MTALITRSPLHILTMTTAQRPPKRRSGRLGAENDEERAMLGGDRDVAQPTAKRVKRDDGRLINGMKLSQSAGDGSGITMTKVRKLQLPIAHRETRAFADISLNLSEE